jgi:hypothetical protein
MPKSKLSDDQIVARNQDLADRLLALLADGKMRNEWEANVALGRDVLHPLPLCTMEALHSQKKIFLVAIDGVYRMKIRRSGDKETDKSSLRKLGEL